MFPLDNHLKLLSHGFKYLALFALLISSAAVHANEAVPVKTANGQSSEINTVAAIENLTIIQQSIETKRSDIRELREQLKKLQDPSEKLEIEEKIERFKNEISNLQLSFRHIALSGVNVSALTDQPDVRINWKDEIEQISRPLLSSLKELTAKPRQLDSLRREIERKENQLKIINRALDSLRLLKTQALPAVTAEPIDQLLTDWEQRKTATTQALEISRYKLASMVTESTAWYTTAGEATTEFLRGRGLTLFLAIIISVAIWLCSKGLIALYWRWLYRSRDDTGVTRAPLVLYSYRLATAIIIVFAILMVFYLRGDILLLTLAVIALAGAALSLRQTLPRYAAELRLLLGIGPVREQERLVLDGVPYNVESLSIYSVLKNPALAGFVRLPLHDMNDHASRPAGDEPWFPCQPGDYIILDNGNLGKVLRQTIELVEIAVFDSRMQIPTRDFLNLNVRNLSRDGYGVACTFGVDYQHQAICLDTVPARFREGITARFDQAGMKDDIKDIMVEFSGAGSSSLDYRIYVLLDGRAASAYFKVQRLIQQACVQVCNEEGWTIPFTQITVHTNPADEATRMYSDQSKSDFARVAVETQPNPT